MTQDIRPPWYNLALNIIRRLQSVARQEQKGYAVLTINVLVRADGNPAEMDGEPLLWTEPEVTKLEPMRAEVIAVLDRLKQS